MRAIAIDFETHPIEPRPHYPPRPVGVAIKEPGERRGRYLAWGHPSANNTSEKNAERILGKIWRSDVPLVFHNAKFDLEVAERWLGLRIPTTDRIHDSMIAGFLADPYARDLGLKPLAETHLGVLSVERDQLRSWILEHVPEARMKQKSWGRFIAQAPGDLVERYAAGDVERTAPLLREFWPAVREMRKAYDREIALIPAILETEREGMQVDAGLLTKDCARYDAVLLQCDRWIQKRLRAPELNVDERDELANAIDRAGLAENGWVLTPKGRRSTKKGSLEAAVSDRLLVAMLSYRGSLATCLRTFMHPWLRMANESQGRVQTSWHSTRGDTDHGARTGRLSSTPNLQNIPTEFERILPLLREARLFEQIPGLPSLPLVRSYVVADTKKHVLCGRDYDGQELRVLAHFEDGALAAGYKANPRMDVHQFVAEEIQQRYDLPLGANPRRTAKTLNFLKIYGGGVPKLAATLGTDLETARSIMRAYEAILPGLRELNAEMRRRGRANEPIRTLGGRLYYAEKPKLVNGQLRTFEYKLLNYLVQGSSADMTKEAWLRYRQARKDSRLLLTVHDEIVICAPIAAQREEMRILKEAMESVELDVPLLSDGEIGYRWTDMKGCG